VRIPLGSNINNEPVPEFIPTGGHFAPPSRHSPRRWLRWPAGTSTSSCSSPL